MSSRKTKITKAPATSGGTGTTYPYKMDDGTVVYGQLAPGVVDPNFVPPTADESILPPKNLKAVVADKWVTGVSAAIAKLSWDNVPDATGYTVVIHGENFLNEQWRYSKANAIDLTQMTLAPGKKFSVGMVIYKGDKFSPTYRGLLEFTTPPYIG